MINIIANSDKTLVEGKIEDAKAELSFMYMLYIVMNMLEKMSDSDIDGKEEFEITITNEDKKYGFMWVQYE